MKAFALLSTLLLLLPFCTPLTIVEDVCLTLVGFKGNYDFCVTSLQAVPESRTADIQGLKIIATQLLEANYTYNLNKAQELLKDQSLPPPIAGALGECVSVYEPASQGVRTVIEKLQSGAFDGIAAELRKVVGDPPRACETAFQVPPEQSPLHVDNTNADLLGFVAYSIVALF